MHLQTRCMLLQQTKLTRADLCCAAALVAASAQQEACLLAAALLGRSWPRHGLMRWKMLTVRGGRDGVVVGGSPIRVLCAPCAHRTWHQTLCLPLRCRMGNSRLRADTTDVVLPAAPISTQANSSVDSVPAPVRQAYASSYGPYGPAAVPHPPPPRAGYSSGYVPAPPADGRQRSHGSWSASSPYTLTVSNLSPDADPHEVAAAFGSGAHVQVRCFGFWCAV